MDNKLAQELQNAIGLNDKGQAVTQFVDTGYPILNKVISGRYDGGIPFGRLVEIYGPSSSGKTAIATMIMANAQKMGGIAGFFDHERSFDVGLAKNFGLDNEFPKFIYKQPDTWEKSNMDMAKAAIAIRKSKAIPDDAPIVFVLDSIASAITQNVFEKEIDERTMNDNTALARATATTMPVMAGLTAKWNFTVIFLNQVREKIGVVYGPKTTTPGGSSMGFYSSVRLELSRSKVTDSTKELVGQTITINAVKNKLTKPFQKCDLQMSWDENGVGYFDVETSIVNALLDAKKIQMSGAWLTYKDKKYQKKQFIKAVKDENLMPELVSLL